MNQYQRRILCACLLPLVLGFSRAGAQDEPAVKVTPNDASSENEPAPADAGQPFQTMPDTPAARSVSAVSRLLAENKDYKTGDLLTWELVKPVLDRLRRARVPMPPERELKAKFLGQNDSLVRLFRTERGKAFFQELGKNPSSIDRVDHYRSLPRGEKFLNEFIRDVDGYKFFTDPQWLDEQDAKWAEEWTLANVPGGNQFGEPTGRIYLESQLIAFLAEYKKSGTARTYE